MTGPSGVCSVRNMSSIRPDGRKKTSFSGNRVARVEFYHFSVALPATFRPSWRPGYRQEENACALVRLVTGDGAEGWSTGPAVGGALEALGGMVGPVLLGEDATDVDRIQQLLREIGYGGWANWWVEPAFWDIKGKLAGRPVCELLGSPEDNPGEVPLYASTGEVKPPAERIREAEARYEEGFRAIKLRVHEDEASDIRQVTETARAVGGDMKVGVDVNQGWRISAAPGSGAPDPVWDLGRAKRFADVCAGLENPVAWIEEPLAMDGYDDLAALTNYSQVPIAGGEIQVSGYPELSMMADRRCYDIFQPDAVFTGGIAQTWRFIRYCREAGLSYTPHTWFNGIGLAINLQLMAASGFAAEQPLEYPYAPPGFVPEVRDAMLVEPFMAENGKMPVPETPGLGFVVDEEALRRYAVRLSVTDARDGS